MAPCISNHAETRKESSYWPGTWQEPPEYQEHFVCVECGATFDSDPNDEWCDQCGKLIENGKLDVIKVSDAETFYACPDCGLPLRLERK